MLLLLFFHYLKQDSAHILVKIKNIDESLTLDEVNRRLGELLNAGPESSTGTEEVSFDITTPTFNFTHQLRNLSVTAKTAILSLFLAESSGVGLRGTFYGGNESAIFNQLIGAVAAMRILPRRVSEQEEQEEEEEQMKEEQEEQEEEEERMKEEQEEQEEEEEREQEEEGENGDDGEDSAEKDVGTSAADIIQLFRYTHPISMQCCFDQTTRSKDVNSVSDIFFDSMSI
jgi:hypothetical protein